MNRAELLEKIIKAIDAIDAEITENTVIADCDDIDSLAIFNVFLIYKELGIEADIHDFSKAETVGDWLKLAGL